MRASRPILLLVIAFLSSPAFAQPYGMTSRPAVGQFLDNVMPESAPVVSGNWSAVVAFTNLTFTNALGVTYIPGSELVLVDQIGDSTWHNGSGMFFHPVNGFLYWTDGDDERAPTQIINQNLFSGVFRIDVDMRGGSISHPVPRQPQNGTTANY